MPRPPRSRSPASLSATAGGRGGAGGRAPRANDRYRPLPGGERQRLALALAIVGRPELAILDEPTAAMDVTARRSTWELLRALRSEGAPRPGGPPRRPGGKARRTARSVSS